MPLKEDLARLSSRRMVLDGDDAATLTSTLILSDPSHFKPAEIGAQYLSKGANSLQSFSLREALQPPASSISPEPASEDCVDLSRRYAAMFRERASQLDSIQSQLIYRYGPSSLLSRDLILKVILIGELGSGKTTFANKLRMYWSGEERGSAFLRESIQPLNLKISPGGSTIRMLLNIIDLLGWAVVIRAPDLPSHPDPDWSKYADIQKHLETLGYRGPMMVVFTHADKVDLNNISNNRRVVIVLIHADRLTPEQMASCKDDIIRRLRVNPDCIAFVSNLQSSEQTVTPQWEASMWRLMNVLVQQKKAKLITDLAREQSGWLTDKATAVTNGVRRLAIVVKELNPWTFVVLLLASVWFSK
ncbi:hypothetical protein HDV00_009580 [Rhizophlyctis rosea]|nr:hypothetical protein HDV00_009580 [Rhizophlyctis rosea]